jgi:hypothetical protein
MSNRDYRDRLLYRFLDQRTKSAGILHRAGNAVPLLEVSRVLQVFFMLRLW